LWCHVFCDNVYFATIPIEDKYVILIFLNLFHESETRKLAR
jgi:hypothetical protein